MPQVLTKLESIMIEAQIQSPIGRQFWSKHFGSIGVFTRYAFA